MSLSFEHCLMTWSPYRGHVVAVVIVVVVIVGYWVCFYPHALKP
jgi:hypothetical protein